jgi:hypothetical protein
MVMELMRTAAAERAASDARHSQMQEQILALIKLQQGT